MPYFTKEYCDTLVGKTIQSIDPLEDKDNHGITIHFTDGTSVRIAACVEREQKPQRSITMVVNRVLEKKP